MKNTDQKVRVNALRKRYSGYDRFLDSKVFGEGRHRYGVTLTTEANKLLKSSGLPPAPGIARVEPREDKRKLPCRVSFRTTDKQFEQLQRIKEELNFSTWQEYESFIHKAFIAEYSKTAHDAGTSQAV